MTEVSKTADKALLILSDLAQHGPATLQRIAERSRINRTVAHRLVVALTARGFVTRTDHTYAVAARVRRLADSVFAELRSAAHGPLDRLAETAATTVVLQVLDGRSVTVLEERAPGTGLDLRVRLEVGTRRGLSESPSGAAAIAALPGGTRERTVAALGLDTPNPTRLEGWVAAALAHGTTSVEIDPLAGLCEAGAPVATGDTAACVALLAPAARADELRRHLGALHATARSIQRSLGG